MNGRRLILAIGVVVFVVIVSIIIFRIDWGGSKAVQEIVRPVNIADYADTDVKVLMSTRSYINSNQEHQVLNITVGRDQTVGELINGYQGDVVRTERTGSNPTSYRAFLSALHNAQFTKSQLPPTGVQYDGVCPTGSRYTFEFIGAGEDGPASLWATSCGKKIGNFACNLSGVKKLFNAQLPKEQFEALTADTPF